MNHQQQKDNSEANESITTQEAINLLFGEGWLEEAVCIEDEANCTIGAGLDWGNALAPLMLNLPLFGRLSTLRVSLNRDRANVGESFNKSVNYLQ